MTMATEGSSEIKPLKKNKKDDLLPLIYELSASINYKYYILMFVIFMFITSDVFIERILGKFTGTLEHQLPTIYGTIIQAFTLIVSMLLIDFLITKEVI